MKGTFVLDIVDPQRHIAHSARTQCARYYATAAANKLYRAQPAIAFPPFATTSARFGGDEGNQRANTRMRSCLQASDRSAFA
mmetsp:Transcript_8787/g.23036  ORF Transcript_8787/g.23036 Transcript_8787/m.23036 type:complete len:82 (+) Transcript_8787:65-310(+)